MKLFTTLTAAAFALANPSFADEITLTTEMEGKTLHGWGVDMSVYFTNVPDGYELVATYVTKSNAAPTRLKMLMTAGDDVKFALPDQPRYTYRFSSVETGISAERIDNMTLLASN